LAERGDEVVGLDNINDYYDTRLKAGRLQELGFYAGERADLAWGEILKSEKHHNLRFVRMGIEDKDAVYYLANDMEKRKVGTPCELLNRAKDSTANKVCQVVRLHRAAK
jgi:UDP-glucuronate 4-epimerase